MQETTSVFSFITLFWEKIGVTYILQKGGDGSGCFYLMVGKGLVFPLPNSQTKFLLNMPMSAMVTKDYQQEHCRILPRLEISSLVCLPSFCTRKQDVKKNIKSKHRFLSTGIQTSFEDTQSYILRRRCMGVQIWRFSLFSVKTWTCIR